MTLEEKKEFAEKIDSRFEDGFLDFYVDALMKTIKGCDSYLHGITLIRLTEGIFSDDSNDSIKEEEIDRMWAMRMDALERIYDVYVDLKSNVFLNE